VDIEQAVEQRRSVRQFLPDPVSDEVISNLLTRASWAPSGGNLQPWRIYVVNGESMVRLRAHLDSAPPLEEPEYDVYPAKLWEPYRTNRFRLGEAMYAAIGIPREDKPARLRQFARNDVFFDAPAALFCFVDRNMGPPQWSDLGMFLQTFMLLAVGAGLGTCAQEYWAVRHQAISSFVGAPESEMLFCGMSLGVPDNNSAINTFPRHRMPLEQWARFV
jgi:nitroreductase